MFETLVSSRIRRTLLEHLLTHPADRFYLRGLAKTLDLSVSPLRRELKRLERSGMLHAVQEANVVFYTVNAASPAFLQLRQAGEVPSMLAATIQEGAEGSRLEALGNRAEDSSLQPRAYSLEHFSWRSPLSNPALIGAAAVGMALVLIVAGLAYLTVTRQQVASDASRKVATGNTKITVIVPSTSASGTMRGSRWQVVPGGFGGFSSGTNQESY